MGRIRNWLYQTSKKGYFKYGWCCVCNKFKFGLKPFDGNICDKCLKNNITL
jgi:hypothetical protein